MVVERALADADFGRDGVDANRANPLQIEQPVRGFEDAVLHGRLLHGRPWCGILGGRGRHANTRAPFVLTAGPLYSLVTQVCVPKSNGKSRTRISRRGP